MEKKRTRNHHLWKRNVLDSGPSCRHAGFSWLCTNFENDLSVAGGLPFAASKMLYSFKNGHMRYPVQSLLKFYFARPHGNRYHAIRGADATMRKTSTDQDGYGLPRAERHPILFWRFLREPGERGCRSSPAAITQPP